MNSKQQMDINELQKLDAQHHLHPFTDAKELNEQGTRVIVKADGVYIWDAQGNKLLDGMAGLWCVNAGYGRKDIAEAAYEQLQQLPYYNSFFQCTTPPTIELSTLLAELAPAHINHVFFTGSGSESNDTVVRMVRRFWDLKGEPQKSVIISRKNAYHGSTMAGASLGGMKFMHEQGGLPLPGIVHIDQPYWFGEAGELDEQEFGLKVAQQLEEKILELGLDRVAAFIAEPIQGAGGVIVPPETYWPEIQRICDQYEILLVADEVITGFGRMGDWFASETYNLKPDFIPFAKGVTSGYLPLGGLLVSDRVADVIISKGGEFTHGFTYSGHPAACAVAIATINFIEREKILAKVKDQTAPYLKKQWESLINHELVGETRIKGMVGAIELSKEGRERYPSAIGAGSICRDLAMDHGIVMRAVGDTMIIAPPLIINSQQIDELMDKTKNTLDATLKTIQSS